MAAFCLSTGQPPEVYGALTRVERQAFRDLIEEARKKVK